MPYNKSPYKKSWPKKSSSSSNTPHNTQHTTRGALAPLMSEEQKSSANIQDLSYDFACRIVRLFQYLNEDAEYKEFVMSKQVLRSGTSIAANMNEAKHPQSDADFLSKSSIALKEARETEFWLNLLHDNGYLTSPQFDSLNHDLDRILRILVTITTKVRERLKQEERDRKDKKNH